LGTDSQEKLLGKVIGLWEKLLICALHIRKTHKPTSHIPRDYSRFYEKALGLWHPE
jgi:hypothetical protein